jgi:hypothetical protein
MKRAAEACRRYAAFEHGRLRARPLRQVLPRAYALLPERATRVFCGLFALQPARLKRSAQIAGPPGVGDAAKGPVTRARCSAFAATSNLAASDTSEVRIFSSADHPMTDWSSPPASSSRSSIRRYLAGYGSSSVISWLAPSARYRSSHRRAALSNFGEPRSA